MAYMTHQFAHLETLQRAQRWLVQMGFDPSHIEVQTGGIPRIALAMPPAQWVEALLLIDAAERTDPEGQPGFWDLAHPAPVEPGADQAVAQLFHHAVTTAIGWHNPDGDLAEDTVVAGIREMMSR
jgi:hypothetical protein